MSRPTENVDPRRVRDRGVSYIEMVIAVALLGTILIAGIDAVTTNIKASSTSMNAAQVETAIVNVADRINRAEGECDYAKYARAAVQTEGWPPETATVEQSYYVPGATPLDAGTWQEGPSGNEACLDGVHSQLMVQQVHVTITSPDGRVRRSITVVKSDV